MTGTDAFAALEKREWSDPGVARSYAHAFARASDMVVPELVAAVTARPGTRALDLCCGHGNVSAGLFAAGATVTGLDFSPPCWRWRARRSPKRGSSRATR
jgi:2-polyprenyl-3-methyl-5-hydroxy-6-metoxy-1,4-benzoquinol methylase